MSILSEKIQTVTHLNPSRIPDHKCKHGWVRCWAPMSSFGAGSQLVGRYYECKKCHGTTTEKEVPIRQRRYLITHGPDAGRTIKYTDLDGYRKIEKINDPRRRI